MREPTFDMGVTIHESFGHTERKQKETWNFTSEPPTRRFIFY